MIAIIFNAVNQFFTEAGSILSYVALFIAITGVGGVYAVYYILVNKTIPTSQVGGAMLITCTIAVLSTTGAPLVVLVPAPFPYCFLAVMLLSSFIISFKLPNHDVNSIKSNKICPEPVNIEPQ